MRAAANMGKAATTIRDQVLNLAGDPSPDVRLQVAIAATKARRTSIHCACCSMSEEISYEDPLIPQVVWQNLHPLLEDRQVDIVRRLEQLGSRDPSFSPLAPHAIEKLLASPRPDAKIIAAFLGRALWHEGCRESIDLLADRFRDGNLPAPLDSLRRELIRVVNEAYQLDQFSSCR